jgi:CheY-like chemotaxis protein
VFGGRMFSKFAGRIQINMYYNKRMLDQSERDEILVVDDDPAIRKRVVREILSAELDLNINVAEDGQEALTKLRQLKKMKKNIVFVLTDVEMPNMDGLQLLTEIKASPSLKEIPVLMLTSVNDKSRVIRAIAHGVTNYIIKPWEDNDLLVKVIACVEKHKLKKNEDNGQGPLF